MLAGLDTTYWQGLLKLQLIRFSEAQFPEKQGKALLEYYGQVEWIKISNLAAVREAEDEDQLSAKNGKFEDEYIRISGLIHAFFLIETKAAQEHWSLLKVFSCCHLKIPALSEYHNSSKPNLI